MSYSRRPQSAAPSAARGGATQARVHASDSLPRRYVIPLNPHPAAASQPQRAGHIRIPNSLYDAITAFPFADDPARAAGGTAQDRRLRQTGGRLVRIPAGLAVRRDVAPARHHGAERTGGPERHPQAARPLRLRGRPEPGSGAVAPAGQARGRVRDRHGSARRTLVRIDRARPSRCRTERSSRIRTNNRQPSNRQPRQHSGGEPCLRRTGLRLPSSRSR